MKKRDITFYAQGNKLAGNLYLPDDYKGNEKLPCVIPCSGFTGINAVYPALIARLLTKHGYACLGFDFRGWAPSEGEVGITSFETEYEDIFASYVFAQQQPEVDPDNISLFGWGMSAPIVIRLAVDYPEIKSVAVGNGIYNGKRAARSTLTVEEFLEHEERAKKDRIARVLNGKGEDYVDCYYFNSSEVTPANRAYLTDTLTRLTSDISEILVKDYGSREAFPPRHNMLYWDSMMRVDAESYVAKLAPRGLFIAHGIKDDGYGFYEAESLYNAAGEGAVLFKTDGGHNDWMFDEHPEFIRFGEALTEFYDTYMK